MTPKQSSSTPGVSVESEEIMTGCSSAVASETITSYAVYDLSFFASTVKAKKQINATKIIILLRY